MVGVAPEQIHNDYESKLGDDLRIYRLICKRACKYTERVLNLTKSNIFVVFCGSTTGKPLPLKKYSM